MQFLAESHSTVSQHFTLQQFDTRSLYWQHRGMASPLQDLVTLLDLEAIEVNIFRGQAPYEEIYLAAINSQNFEETSCTGSLRILQRVK